LANRARFVTLARHCSGKIADDKLRNLTLVHVIIFLYGLGLIDQPTCSKMLRVKDMRDGIVHNPFKEIDAHVASNLIEDAIDSLKYLGIAD
jgi:hypothetical protein